MGVQLPAVTYEDIENLHETFVLFGASDAPYWFLGLEEGDHPTESTVIDEFLHSLLRKTKKYKDAGAISLRALCAPDDGYSFMPKIEDSEVRSGRNVKYQSTWGGYIKLLLSVEMYGTGKSWSTEDVKQYQKYDLGELNISGDLPKSCLMELFPMARKGRKKAQWPYAELASRKGMDFMDNPSSYQAYAQSKRVDSFLGLVKQYEPKYLVCFGGDCRRALVTQIEETPLQIEVDQGKKTLKVSTVMYGKTRILFSNHPTSHGISNLYWKNLGKELALLG